MSKKLLPIKLVLSQRHQQNGQNSHTRKYPILTRASILFPHAQVSYSHTRKYPIPTRASILFPHVQASYSHTWKHPIPTRASILYHNV